MQIKKEKLEEDIRKKLSNNNPKLVKKIGYAVFKIGAEHELKKQLASPDSIRDNDKIKLCRMLIEGLKVNDEEMIEIGLRGLGWLK